MVSVYVKCIYADNVRDQVVPILSLLETAESHLGTWNVFLGVL